MLIKKTPIAIIQLLALPMSRPNKGKSSRMLMMSKIHPINLFMILRMESILNSFLSVMA